MLVRKKYDIFHPAQPPADISVYQWGKLDAALFKFMKKGRMQPTAVVVELHPPIAKENEKRAMNLLEHNLLSIGITQMLRIDSARSFSVTVNLRQLSSLARDSLVKSVRRRVSIRLGESRE